MENSQTSASKRENQNFDIAIMLFVSYLFEVTHAYLGPIWYHSEPSDVPYYPNQFLGWDFFAISHSKTALAESP